MTQEPISKKLSDLFELFKSGALGKEEYDQLKAQIINSEDSGEPVRVTKDIPPEVGKEPVNKSSYKEETAKSTNKRAPSKKGNSLWVVSIVALVSVLAAFLIFNTSIFSKKPEITSQKEQTVTDLEEERTVTDIDGNVYTTVKIGTQVWMVENLRTTKYNDGTPIPLVTDNSAWRALTTPAYCWYNNDEIGYKESYGAIYNWYTVNSNKLCPEGWHVPTATDWKILTTYLTNYGYGYQDSGDDIAKSLAGTLGWDSSSKTGTVGNDAQSNNRSGFSAYASGIRFSNGEFRHSGQNGKWWSSTETSTNAAQIRFISWDDGIVSSYSNRKENGFSVRCVKN